MSLSVAGSAALAGELDAAMRRYAEREVFGEAALVTRGEVTLLRAGYGPADWDAGAPNRPETGYPIASLTKALTALPCIQREAAGARTFDAPIADLHEGVFRTL